MYNRMYIIMLKNKKEYKGIKVNPFHLSYKFYFFFVYSKVFH